MAGGGKKKRFFPSTNKKNPADPEKKAANKEKYGKLICKGTDHLAKDCPSKPVWNDWGSKTPQKANPKAATTAEGAHKKLAGGDDLEDDFADNVEDFAEEGDVNAADTEDADKQQSDKKRKKSDAPPASTAKKAKKVAKVVKF
eukprot:gene11883-14035_t